MKRRLTETLLVLACCLTVLLSYAAISKKPSAPAPDSAHLKNVKVQIYGEGETKDTRYELVIENGKIDAGEYTHQKGIRASDGTAGFRTELAENNQRRVHLFIEGTQNKTSYIDIDGDGILDAMENRTTDKLFIWAEETWVEVGRSKVGFSIGGARRTIDHPRIYVFKDSHWVSE